MMTPAPRPNSDDATAILRRLEPMLTTMQTEQQRQAEILMQLAVEVAELRGRVSQLPNLFQIIGPAVVVNAGAMALALGLAGLILR